jgi:hypothetical protein
VAGTVLCVLAVATACGVPESTAEPIPRDELPESLRGPETTASAPQMSTEPASVAVYWVSDRRLVPEAVTFEQSPDATRLIDLLERGPASASSGVRSAVSGPNVLAGVSVREPSVDVDVGPAFDDLTASEQTLAVAQVVATLTTVPGVERVSIRRDGDVVDVPLPDGTLVRRPLLRADFASMLG